MIVALLIAVCVWVGLVPTAAFGAPSAMIRVEGAVAGEAGDAVIDALLEHADVLDGADVLRALDDAGVRARDVKNLLPKSRTRAGLINKAIRAASTMGASVGVLVATTRSSAVIYAFATETRKTLVDRKISLSGKRRGRRKRSRRVDTSGLRRALTPVVRWLSQGSGAASLPRANDTPAPLSELASDPFVSALGDDDRAEAEKSLSSSSRRKDDRAEEEDDDEEEDEPRKRRRRRRYRGRAAYDSFSIGLVYMLAGRDFAYSDPVSDNLRPYTLFPGSFPTLHVFLAPFALAKADGALEPLFLRGQYGFALGVSSSTEDATIAEIGTTWSAWKVGAGYAASVGTGMTLSPILSYGATDFSFSLPAGDDPILDILREEVVGVSYAYVAPELRFSIDSSSYKFGIEAGYQQMLSAEGIGTRLFPRASTSGLHAGIDLDVKVTGDIWVVLAGDYTRVSYDLNPESSATFVATSAVDQFYAVGLGVRYAVR